MVYGFCGVFAYDVGGVSRATVFGTRKGLGVVFADAIFEDYGACGAFSEVKLILGLNLGLKGLGVLRL